MTRSTHLAAKGRDCTARQRLSDFLVLLEPLLFSTLRRLTWQATFDSHVYVFKNGFSSILLLAYYI